MELAYILGLDPRFSGIRRIPYQNYKNKKRIINPYEEIVMSIGMEMKEKFYDYGNWLPTCINEGCDNNVSVRNWSTWSFRTECSSCSRCRLKKLKYPVGVIQHKKEYCENIDGHLGFSCPVDPTSWPDFQGALDLEHDDGDHDNNDRNNVKTICKICHMRKSKDNDDFNSYKDSSRNLDS